MEKRTYNFFEIQSLGTDNKWRRFKQSPNDITLEQAQVWAKNEITEEIAFLKNLNNFVSMPSSLKWRLVKVIKICEDVNLE